MNTRSSHLTAVMTATIFLLTAGFASAQGVLFVKDNKVGIGEPEPGDGPILTLKTDDGFGAGFKVQTTNAPNNQKWFFQQNKQTGAFLISNFFGGVAQFQIYPNVSGNNPPSTFVVRQGGVGIGTQNPGANRFNVAIGKTTLADEWSTRSSRRYKENIRPLEGALDKLQQIRGVSYDLKSSGHGSIGFIAEEVGEVLPELVRYEENGTDAVSLDYDKMAAILVEAVKAQQQQIEELQRQLAER